jgi:hypothetical protein
VAVKTIVLFQFDFLGLPNFAVKLFAAAGTVGKVPFFQHDSKRDQDMTVMGI